MSDGLVVQVLRVICLCEKEPALHQQANVLHKEGSNKKTEQVSTEAD